MTDQEIIQRISQDGFVIIQNVISPEFAVRCKTQLKEAIDAEAQLRGAAGQRDYAMVLLCSLYGEIFNQVFENDELMRPFNLILGERCIVYAYTSSSMPPGSTNYSNRIHVDCPRLIPGYITNMGATIALDDFTADNGATYFLPGSQNRLDPPSTREFKEGAKRFIAPVGSVFFFNARLWHSGGDNHTKYWRHALTINMCRSYMKQRIDIPRAMEHMDTKAIPERAKQKLGFFSQPPASVEEYYLPVNQRNFKHPAE